LYELDGALYMNLTNRCPCRCAFCIRQNGDGVGSADTLWLESEPAAAEVTAALAERDLSQYREIVFCGYGEPTCAMDVLLNVCRWLKSYAHDAPPVRLNTNGLGDLINGSPVAPLLAGLVDTVSVSLNAPTAEEYEALCQPVFGPASFDALLAFAKDCQVYVPHVTLTVVDVLAPDTLARCEAVARQAGLPLRVRAKA
ncbi:MAG: TatD family nuclease-associated radical SAM protein, partial [Oscillospiraceae bacterium]|nr:TatD family nuclease-associated radical SAM protein [Oscillospiraceae bacterium]